MKVLLKILMIFFFCIASLKAESEKISLLLKWKHQFQFAGFYMAKEKGFYQEENLDVSIFEANQFSNGVDALENLDVNYAVLNPQDFISQINGSKIRPIASIMQHSPLVLVSLKSSGIKEPSDLINKKLMLELGVDDAAIMVMLEKKRVSKASLQLSKTTFDIQDLIDGKVDAMGAYITDQIYDLNKRGIDYNIIDPIHYGVDFLGDMLFTSSYEYNKNPKRVKKFLNATIKGWRYALDNVDETISIIKDKYKSHRTIEHLKYEAKEIANLVRQERIPLGYLSEERILDMLELFKQQGLIKEKTKISKNEYFSSEDKLPAERFWDKLTLEEMAYIQNKDSIQFAVMDNIPPYHYLNSKGNSVGTHAEIFKMLKEYTGLPLELKSYPWATLMEKFKKRELDAFFGQQNDERKTFTDFSDVIVPLSYGIFSINSNQTVYDVKDMEGYKVAIVEGFAVKEMLTKYPKIKIIEKRTLMNAINSVLTGESDYIIGHILSINFFRKKYIINDLFLNGLATEKGGGSRIGIRNDHPLLVSIIKKALAMIPKKELESLYEEWIFTDQKIMQKQQKLRLTTKEKDWLKKHPVLRVGKVPDWAPFYFIKNGEPEGYAVDLQKKLAEYIGVKLDFVIPKSFPEAIEKFKNKQIDMMPIFGKNEVRKKFTIYSDPILVLKPVLAFNKNSVIFNSLKELEDNKKVLGVVRDYWLESYFKTNYPNLKLKEFSNLKENLEALSKKEVDAIADTSNSIKYYINKHLMMDIKLGNEITLKDQYREFHIGIRDDWDIFKGIMRKAYFAISEDEIIRLQKKWFGESLGTSASLFILSEEEEKFLKNLPSSTINLGIDSHWPPIEFMDNGEYKGVTKEFIEYVIKDRLELSFIPKRAKRWKDQLDSIDRLEIDMLAGLMETSSRREKMLFSIPYLTMPLMVFGREDNLLIQNLENLNGKEVAVVKGHVSEELLKRKYPKIIVKGYDKISDALIAVSNKKIDYVFETLPPVNYYIQEIGINNLKLLIKSEENVELSIGVRKDWPMMINILNKAIRSISEKKRQEIYENWINININTQINYDLLWKTIGGFIVLLSIFLAWNQMLRREIKKRKETEKNLYQAQLRAEAANKAKSEFLSNMSHEIRTPMNAVIGFAELTAKMDLPSKAIENIKIIQKSGKTLIALINDILDLSKIEAGKFEIKKEPINIEDLVEELYSMFHLKAQSQGLDFNINIASYIPKILMLDEIRIRQILMNLIGNALKFTKEGSVLVSFEVYVNEHMDSTLDLHIKVRDTGIGVSEENREKIFGLFEQQSGQNTRLYGGTGLGLAISQKLANLMNGEIVLTQSSNKGSTFTLILKHITVASISKSKKAKSSDSIITFAFAKVLIVDDIAENLILLKDALESYGFLVMEATSGKEAIVKAKEDLPQIVLMDIKMPEMDGYDASRLIREQEETKDIPIIAVSASVLKEKEEISNHEAFDGFIPKPINMEELELELAKYLPHSYTKKSAKAKEKDKILFNCSNEKKLEIQILSKEVLDDGDLLLAENLLELIKKENALPVDMYDNLKKSVDNFNIEDMEKYLRQIIEE